MLVKATCGGTGSSTVLLPACQRGSTSMPGSAVWCRRNTASSDGARCATVPLRVFRNEGPSSACGWKWRMTSTDWFFSATGFNTARNAPACGS